jgi:hypothetical protein
MADKLQKEGLRGNCGTSLSDCQTFLRLHLLKDYTFPLIEHEHDGRLSLRSVRQIYPGFIYCQISLEAFSPCHKFI